MVHIEIKEKESMSQFLKKRDWGKPAKKVETVATVGTVATVAKVAAIGTVGSVAKVATVAKNTPANQSAPRATPHENEKVTAQFIGENSGEVLDVRDISTSGIGVYVGAGFIYGNVQKEQQFVIKLPSRPSFLVTGFVKHYRTKTDGREHLGIEFRKISDKYKMVVRDYVNTCIKEEKKNKQETGSFVTVGRIRT
jgi:hypothetical protein